MHHPTNDFEGRHDLASPSSWIQTKTVVPPSQSATTTEYRTTESRSKRSGMNGAGTQSYHQTHQQAIASRYPVTFVTGAPATDASTIKKSGGDNGAASGDAGVHRDAGGSDLPAGYGPGNPAHSSTGQNTPGATTGGSVGNTGAQREPLAGYSVAYTHELQRTEELLEAIADWRATTGAERGTNRRWAMRLLAAERRRRDAGRAALRQAATKVHRRQAA